MSQDRPSLRSDILQERRSGRRCAGVIYLSRAIREALGPEAGISREQVHLVLNALGDQIWHDLLDGHEYQIGRVCRMRLAVRGPTVQVLPNGERIDAPAMPIVAGAVMGRFREAWFDRYGLRYQDDRTDDDWDPEWDDGE